MDKFRFTRTLLFLAVFIAALSAAKRPLNHHDYDAWKTISSETLSRDGKFLAYSLFPEEGDGEIVVRNLATGKDVREPAGSVPDAPADAGAEEPAAGPQAARGVRLSFTYDNHYLVSSTFPSKAATDQAKKDKKPAPHGGLVIIDLATSKVTRIADVASFQLAAKGDSYLAYLKEAAPAVAPAAAPAEKDDETLGDQGRGGGGRGGARGGARKFGAEMILRDLRGADGKERSFADVSEYSLTKDGRTLLYNVSSKNEDTNGVYMVTPGTEAPPSTLLSGKGRYTKLTWDRDQKRLVFFSDRDDTASKPAKFKLYSWTLGGAVPAPLITTATQNFRAGYVLADRGPVTFSRDGSRLFVSCAPEALVADAEKDPAAITPADSSDKVLADLWRWNDDYIQPMQKVRLAQERSRTYRAVYTFANKQFLQLADATMTTLNPADNGRYAIGTDDRSYRRMQDYDGTYSDLYVVDTNTGVRNLAVKKLGGGGGRGGGAGLSPDAKHLLWYQDKSWWTMSVPNGTPVNLTAGIKTAFFNEEHDSPDAAPSYGSAGWTKDGKSVLLYDRHDIWQVSPDTLAAERITDGGPSNLQFRVVQLDRGEEDEEPGIDPAKPLLLHAENLETRDTGFYSLAKVEKGLTAKKLLMGAKAYRAISKAKDADVVLMSETTFHEEPNLFVTNSSFEAPKKVTTANPQMADLLWGNTEMISYRNDDGVQLQGVLYKPENFDPKKKYPMIIYIYERLSQNINAFVPPRPGHSINITYYVSNGYLVLTPDIIYTTGHPGQSALKCVLPAIESIVARGFVDRAHIGFQGHSWGGYQGAYLLTQTNIFAAAETGAPVANMISAYDGIRWGPGVPRQFQYEKTQSRIGGTIWEKPLLFIENSPIFMLDRVTTPVMIIANDADDAVPWYQGIEMFLGLRRLGKEAYLFNYNGEPHHLNRRPNQKDYTMRMQQFFDHYLKGGPTPEWMEKGVPYMDREKEKERFSGATVSEGGDHKP
jgi:dipeptidyl aminopeptidase/acylaminoacyl peptidase